jgi:hypothetical protein
MWYWNFFISIFWELITHLNGQGFPPHQSSPITALRGVQRNFKEGQPGSSANRASMSEVLYICHMMIWIYSDGHGYDYGYSSGDHSYGHGHIYIEWIRMVHPGPLLGWFCELRGPEGRLFLSHFVAIKTSAEDIEMSNSGWNSPELCVNCGWIAPKLYYSPEQSSIFHRCFCVGEFVAQLLSPVRIFPAGLWSLKSQWQAWQVITIHITHDWKSCVDFGYTSQCKHWCLVNDISTFRISTNGISQCKHCIASLQGRNSRPQWVAKSAGEPQTDQLDQPLFSPKVDGSRTTE